MITKTERLCVKIQEADKCALRRMAQLEGVSMAVVIRQLIRERARKMGLLNDAEVSPNSVSGKHRRDDGSEISPVSNDSFFS